MKCLECGSEFRPSGHGKPGKYCSGACKAKAYRRRKRNGGGVEAKPAKPRARKTAAKPEADDAALDKRTFDRMMDESMEDVLRRNRDRLQAALDDIATPANALPAISRQLIAVCERIESLSGGGLADLLDEESEVVDVGASIV